MDNTLEAFKMRRQRWIDCLSGKDRHSILNQIYDLVWDAAAFRVINEGRKIAPRREKGGVQLNGLVYRLMDHCYFGSQMLAIRRLTDTYPLERDRGKHDVYSLCALLEDMQSHASQMTRANIFAAEGRDYDVESVKRKADAYALEMVKKREEVYPEPRDLDWEGLEQRHKEIDSLADVSADRRLQTDTVRPEILKCLKERVNGACDKFSLHVDKFLAHAASPKSRLDKSADDLVMTFGDLGRAQRTLCEVANFVGRYLLDEGVGSLLIVPQYNQFAYIDKPLVTTEGIAPLRDVWEAYEEETEKWSNWGMTEFKREFESDKGEK